MVLLSGSSRGGVTISGLEVWAFLVFRAVGHQRNFLGGALAFRCVFNLQFFCRVGLKVYN